MKCVRRTLANRMIPFDSEHSSDAGSATQKDSRYHVPCSCVVLSLSWFAVLPEKIYLSSLIDIGDTWQYSYCPEVQCSRIALLQAAQDSPRRWNPAPTRRTRRTRRVQVVSMCRDNVIPAASANISLARARLVSEDQDKNAQYHLQREVNTQHYQCVPEHSAPPWLRREH